MSLELAMENLAVAMNRQAAILEKIAEAGVAFVATPAQLPEGAAVTNASAASAPAEKKTRGPNKPKPEEKPATKTEPENNDSADDDDNWDDLEETAPETKSYTAADIRELVLKVRDKGGEKKNAEAAKAILTKLGVKSMSEIKEADYAKAAELCNKALK